MTRKAFILRWLWLQCGPFVALSWFTFRDWRPKKPKRNNWKRSEQPGGFRELVGSRVRVLTARKGLQPATITGNFFAKGTFAGWYARVDGARFPRPFAASKVLPEESDVP